METAHFMGYADPDLVLTKDEVKEETLKSSKSQFKKLSQRKKTILFLTNATNHVLTYVRKVPPFQVEM